MAAGLRRSFLSAVLSLLAMVVATAALPPRVRLGTSSLTCETVLHRRDSDSIAAALCQRAEAYQLRASLAIAVLVVVLSFMPMAMEGTPPWRARSHVLWVGGVVLVAVGAVVLLTALGVTPRVFVDL